MQTVAEKPNKPAKRTWITIDQIAEELDVSRELVRRLIDEKELPAYRFGRQYKVDRVDFEQYVESQRTIPKEP